MNGRLKSIIAVGGLCLYLAVAAPVSAADAPAGGQGLLSENALSSASPVALGAESDLLKAIGDGLVLALVRCQEDKSCDLSREEVRHFLNLLNQRINLIAIRHAQTGEKALEPILISYADERDKLAKVLTQLKKALPSKSQNEDN